MAFYDTTWYCNAGDQSTTGHYAVTKWAATTAIAAGALRRQLAAPAVNSERVFVCIIAGTTGSTEPTWVLTRGAKTTDGTVTWMECTGASAVNGDLTNASNWTAAKATGTPTLGAIIKRNNGASYQICTTAGTLGASEPSFSDTAGVTTTETAGSTVWTSLGVVGNFTGGQAPHARLFSAFALNWWAAGNTIYIGDNHAETQAANINLQPAGTMATVSKVLCHNHSGSYPPTALTTGASITTTSGTQIQYIPTLGVFYNYGIKFSSNAYLNLGSGSVWMYFDTCALELTGAASYTLSIPGSGTGWNFFNNTTCKFGGTGQNIALAAGQLVWQNTGSLLASGSVIPTNFMTLSTNAVSVVFEAVDLSQLTGNLVNSSSNAVGSIVIKDCKLNASMAIPLPGTPGPTVQLVRSDSGATAYKSTRYVYEGTETTEASVTRVGGAADAAGQAQSRKIVTTANSQWLRPFYAEPYAIWNPTTGANVTVTVYGTINAGALPNNDDIWLEIEYLGSSATPLGTMVTTTKSSVLAANAAVASDGSTWNGGGSGAGWSPFKLTATLSSPQPAMAGYLHARVRAAKPSTTFYLDPKVVLS